MDICLHTFWDVNHNFIGGTERFLIELSKELSLLGYNPFIVCSGDNSEKIIQGIPVYGVVPKYYKKSFMKYGEAKVDFLRENFSNGLSYNEGLKKLSRYVEYQISQFKSDIVHLNSFPSASFFSSKSPVIVTNHENEKESNAIWGDKFFENFKSIFYCNSSTLKNHFALAVPSKYYAQEYSSKFGVEIKGINQGVNLSTFRKKASQKSLSKINKLNILLPSRLEPIQKGHDIALEACKIILDKKVDVNMIFTGVRQDNQETIKRLRSHAKNIGILNNITIKSFYDINDAYMIADIIISPERYCSYGLSISESLSLGKPTVLSNIPTYVEIAKGFSHAYFFKSGSKNDLAEKILDALKNVSSKKNLHDMIRFRKKYDLRECAKKYSELYLKAIHI